MPYTDKVKTHIIDLSLSEEERWEDVARSESSVGRRRE